MRYVAAYLLAALGGKDNPSSADIEKILSSVGIEAEGEKLKKVISELNGKNIEELIAAGNLILEIRCKMWGSLQL
jgi:large subunit ribosomal protein LP2